MWQNKQGNFFLQSVIYDSMHVMLRQSCFWASRASPAQKSRGLRVVLFLKLFKGYIFCFLGHSVGRYVFELFAHEKAQCEIVVYTAKR